MKYFKAAAVLCLLAVVLPAMAAQIPVKKEETSPEKKELEKLTLENGLEKQKQAQKLQPLQSELEELRTRYNILSEKQKIEKFPTSTEKEQLSDEQTLLKLKEQQKLRQLILEKEELILQNMLDSEREKRDTAVLTATQKKLDLENRIEEAKRKQELALLHHEYAQLKLKNDLTQVKLQEKELLYGAEKAEIDLELKRLSLKSQQMKFEDSVRQDRIAKLKADISMRSQKEEWKQEANTDPRYDALPFANGRLMVSDRRIPLNGPIFRGVADFITERIHYFNNENSEKPIFIVIDSSPGGSVMEGYRILKAIASSKAPVHVVLKSYAASMAAAIVTLSERSYAYPNAVILHHEMSTLTWGNMTQLKEQLEIAKEWEKRLMGPVAKKAGMSIEDFRKAMYKHNSDGDWEEFADAATKLKWVGSIVNEVRETGVVKRPDDKQKPVFTWPFGLEEKVDEKGHRYVTLPRLNPYDMYYIHNPDNYYR
ncbi:MAG: ATP-dependent Clp protease proteolytic subunit [Elusimicrobiota bacterium]